MSKQKVSRKEIKRRPGRTEMVRSKRAAAAMATVEDLAAQLGIGRNQAYALLKMKAVPALRFGRRWLIPRAAIAKLVSGEAATATTTTTAERKAPTATNITGTIG